MNRTAELARRKQIYGIAVDRLFAVGFRITDSEYRKLKNFIEEARVQAEIAGWKMEEHQFPSHAPAELVQ
jgi:hypothetical protein